jgi:hypothetical protein
MTDYTELKRLAEAAKDKKLGTLTVPVSVVLSMIAEIYLLTAHCNQKGLQLVAMDKLTSDLQDERDSLSTQNQALLEALKKISLTQYHIETPPMESLEEKMRNIARKAINLTRGRE